MSMITVSNTVSTGITVTSGSTMTIEWGGPQSDRR